MYETRTWLHPNRLATWDCEEAVDCLHERNLLGASMTGTNNCCGYFSQHRGDRNLGEACFPGWRAQHAGMAATPGDRYRALIQQMGEEMDHVWGWQTKVAKRLGVRQTYVSMIWTGARPGGGGAAIEAAIANLGLDPQFFYGEFAETPHYRAFLPQAAEEEHLERPEAYPALATYLDGPEGRALSAGEREHLRSMRFRDGQPTELTYHYELMKLRSILTPEQAAASEKLMAEAETEALARGGRKVSSR